MRRARMKGWERFDNLLGWAASRVQLFCNRGLRVLVLRGTYWPGPGQRFWTWVVWLGGSEDAIWGLKSSGQPVMS